MKPRLTLPLVLVAVLLLVSVPVYGGPITFVFTGSVRSINDANGYLSGHPGVYVGAPLHGEITYDLDAADLDPRTEYGAYSYPAPPTQILFRVDGLLFSSDLGNDRPYDGGYDLLLATQDDLFIMITNATSFPADVDVANLRERRGGNAIHFQLNGEAGTLATDALPTDLRLSDWQSGIVAVTSSGFDAHDYYDIVGTIDTLKPHPTTPVPDPGSTLLLFGISLIGLRGWRKRERHFYCKEITLFGTTGRSWIAAGLEA